MITPAKDGHPLADHATERGVLGALLVRHDLFPEAVAGGLAPEDFASPSHAATFRALVRLGSDGLRERPVTALVAELERAGDLALAGGPLGVSGFVQVCAESWPAEHRVDLLRVAVERLRMLSRARRVRNRLRAALLVIAREPSQACEVLAELQRAA